jgi:hypothetical protein
MKATFGKVDARSDNLLADLSEFEIEDFVGRLTEAAYEVSLRRGFRGSFLELELELWHTLGSVVKQNRPAWRSQCSHHAPLDEFHHAERDDYTGDGL